MEHTFSVEMKSKNHVRHVLLSNESPDRVLFEGVLGELEEPSMVGGEMLELKESNGVLRIDLSEDEPKKMLSKKKR